MAFSLPLEHLLIEFPFENHSFIYLIDAAKIYVMLKIPKFFHREMAIIPEFILAKMAIIPKFGYSIHLLRRLLLKTYTFAYQ
jgi:hypothetical protein